MPNTLRLLIRILVTGVIVIVAIMLGTALWETYMLSPWTRDGRVSGRGRRHRARGIGDGQ